MKKVILTAAIWAAMNMTSVTAQTIKVINQCGEKTRIVNFTKTDAYSYPISYHSIGSICPKQEAPKFKIEAGNYGFNHLPKQDSEDWYCEIKKNGKIIRKGVLTLDHFDTIMDADMELLIVISPKMTCNCD